MLTCLSCCSDILLLSGMALACSMAELITVVSLKGWSRLAGRVTGVGGCH